MGRDPAAEALETLSPCGHTVGQQHHPASQKPIQNSVSHPQGQAPVTHPGTTYRSNWLVTLFSYSSGYLTPCSLRADPTFSAIHINTNQLTTAVKMTAPYKPGRGTKADVMAPAHGYWAQRCGGSQQRLPTTPPLVPARTKVA